MPRKFRPPVDPALRQKRPALPRTRALYDEYVEQFRRDSRIARVAAHFGVTWTTARIVYHDGWEGIPWARPIKKVLEQDVFEEENRSREQARRDRARELEAREAEQEAKREALKAERQRAQNEEATLVTSTRRGLQQLASVVLALSPAAAQMVRVVMREAFDETAGPDGKPQYTPKAIPTIKPDAAMKYLNAMAQMAARVTVAGVDLSHFAAERRGPEPTVGAVEMTEEENEEALQHARSILWSLDEEARLKREDAYPRPEAPAVAREDAPDKPSIGPQNPGEVH